MELRSNKMLTRSMGEAVDRQVPDVVKRKPLKPLYLASPFTNGRSIRIILVDAYVKIEFAKFWKKSCDEVAKHLNVDLPQEWANEKQDPHITATEFGNFVEKWNRAVDEFRSKAQTQPLPVLIQQLASGNCPDKVLMDALKCCRDIVIRDEYELESAAYGNSKYGQTADGQVLLTKTECNIGRTHTIVDLGCGYGNIVCALAPYVKRAVGIEFEKKVSDFGTAHHKMFSKMMSWLGIHNMPIELHNNDMLDAQFHDLITKEADFIFVNNTQFESELMNPLKAMLAECKVGTKIISTEPLIDVTRETRGGPVTRNPLATRCTTKLLEIVENNNGYFSKSCKFYLTDVQRPKSPPTVPAPAKRSRRV